METAKGNVEIYIAGALVYTTREVGVPFEDTSICDAEDVVRHLSSIENMPQEVLVVMSLNGANKPIKTRWITIGLLDSNQVHPREVFADPLMDRAAGVIIAHNHPSGTLEPSSEDLALTRRLQKGGELLGIKVLDHIIISPNGFISLKRQGMM